MASQMYNHSSQNCKPYTASYLKIKPVSGNSTRIKQHQNILNLLTLYVVDRTIPNQFI